MTDNAEHLMLHVVLASEGEKPHPADVHIVVLPGGVNPFALLAEACRFAEAGHQAEGADLVALRKMADRFGLMARTEDAYPTGGPT